MRVHTAARAGVTTVAHYRTTSTAHHGTAGRKGNLPIAYRIKGATPGFKVHVSVCVVKGQQDRQLLDVLHSAPVEGALRQRSPG